MNINTRFRLFVKAYHRSERFDLDNSLKTLLDCLQAVGAIEDDKLCFSIMAEKYIDRYSPQVEFALGRCTANRIYSAFEGVLRLFEPLSPVG